MHLELLEKALHYRFNNKHYLQEALTHPSLNQNSNNKIYDYERLELLGDSILSFVIIDILLKKFPDLSEGKIAKIKSILVSKDILYKISLDIKLGDFILMSQGEEMTGGRENLNNLTNVLEALIAAIYLDSNMFNVHNIINFIWSKHLQDLDLVDCDPKTFLQEWGQAQNYGIPRYEVIDRCGAKHSPVFTIKVILGKLSVISTGSSIKNGEKNAARKFISEFLKKE